MHRLIVALLMANLATIDCASSQSDDVVWAKTVNETVKDILAHMPAAEQKHLQRMTKDELIGLHQGFGTSIRNHYGLWKGNAALLISACGHPCHPDDASMKIIEAVWQELQR